MTDSLSGPEPEPRTSSDGTDGTSSAGTPAEPAGALADGMAAAARRAGFSPAADGEPISGHALLAAMGGIRGLVEAVLPGLVFLVAYTITRDLIPALIASVLVGVWAILRYGLVG